MNNALERILGIRRPNNTLGGGFEHIGKHVWRYKRESMCKPQEGQIRLESTCSFNN
jgi:hypothetical protein